ncbi:hypothetical protein D8674_005028 [Pyrus ussuriensis x Pyrus communis]|uniref:Uncharacterized protein n=1 Tax=Pyrus ussuriensis x Pyrus communis TaxID=2448454 RepID=A0A5N5FUN0_9ROSA|nr:hypothetical protein D8674_005028 [Pyrus ussuriensis x Pyrus communis]
MEQPTALPPPPPPSLFLFLFFIFNVLTLRHRALRTMRNEVDLRWTFRHPAAETRRIGTSSPANYEYNHWKRH